MMFRDVVVATTKMMILRKNLKYAVSISAHRLEYTSIRWTRPIMSSAVQYARNDGSDDPTVPSILRGFEQPEWADWAARLTFDSVPFHKMPVTFARSSGAGGQNVNKVNTKVQMRLRLSSQESSFLPASIKQQLRTRFASRINSADEIVVASDTYRTQPENRDECCRKIFALIKEAAFVPEPPSQATLSRIEQHAVTERNRLRRDKDRQRSKRDNRRISKRDD